MTVDYIVSSLPALRFGDPAPISAAKFAELWGDRKLPARWTDLETQLRNAMARARGGEKFCRAAEGCDLYWQNRVSAAFQEQDALKRDEALDRVWWDAAGELTPAASPLGEGALATYAVRLQVALKRSMINTDAGNAAFDRLTAETKVKL